MRFSKRTPSQLYSQTGRPCSSLNAVRYAVLSNSLPAPGLVQAGQRHDFPVRPAQLLADGTQHDRAPEGRGQSSDQQGVIAPCQRSGDGTRGIASEAIGDQPLLPYSVSRPASVLSHRRRRTSSVSSCAIAIDLLRAQYRRGMAANPPPIGTGHGGHSPATIFGGLRWTSERATRSRRAAPAAAPGCGLRRIRPEIQQYQPFIDRTRRRSAARTPPGPAPRHRCPAA